MTAAARAPCAVTVMSIQNDTSKNKMQSEQEFRSIFDYRSTFQYENFEAKPFNKTMYRSAFSYHGVSAEPLQDAGQPAKESWPSLVLRIVVVSVLYLFVIALFPISLWVCIKRVRALERLVLMRLGQLQPIGGPGWTLVLPLADRWTRVDLRPRRFTLETMQLLTRDGAIVEASTDIEYQVSDVLRYVLASQRRDEALQEMALLCLRNFMSEKDQEDLERNRALLDSNVKDELNRSAMAWGLEITHVYLHSVKVVKAAEPVDALGTLLIALKAVLEPPPGSRPKAEPSPATEEGGEEALRRLVSAVQQKGWLAGCSTDIRIEAENKIWHCCLQNGEASISESNSSLDCELTLNLKDGFLEELLQSKISPLDAFLEGKVAVKGSWSKLAQLASTKILF